MVTIQDVAKHAGVSVATVSHVLNKTRYVSPKLEEKVELSESLDMSRFEKMLVGF